MSAIVCHFLYVYVSKYFPSKFKKALILFERDKLGAATYENVRLSLTSRSEEKHVFTGCVAGILRSVRHCHKYN